MEIRELKEIISQISFREYVFKIHIDSPSKLSSLVTPKFYLQAEYFEPDVITKEMKLQKTRKWILSQYMTKSEVVQTAFKCALTSMEHRTREHFLYKNERVFSPHYDVEALVELCRNKRFDERENWYAEINDEQRWELEKEEIGQQMMEEANK